jgi:hypothetical protein
VTARTSIALNYVRPTLSPVAPSGSCRKKHATQKITPSLWYAKDADKAAAFYASIFPDSRVDRVTPRENESPSGRPRSATVAG